jgi:hypothetical protein
MAVATEEIFANQLKQAQELLRARLERSPEEAITDDGSGELVRAIFDTAVELGLTEQEVVRQLVLPVAALLRPGLTG